MKETAVMDVHLGRFYQPIADIRMPGGKAPDEE